MRTLLICMFVLLAVPASLSADVAEANTLVARQIRERLDAYGRGDARAWSAFVDDDCVCAADSKSDIVRALSNRPAAVKNWYGEILDLKMHAFGDAIIARYRIAEFTQLEGKLNRIEEWRTETHVRRAGHWVLVAATDNPIPADPAEIALSREALLKFAGKYQYTPGSVDVVTVENGRLFVQSDADPKIELFAQTPTMFFAKGKEWRLVFTVDPDGTVASVTFRQQGQEYVGTRQK